jgi:hypothetical protein
MDQRIYREVQQRMEPLFAMDDQIIGEVVEEPAPGVDAFAELPSEAEARAAAERGMRRAAKATERALGKQWQNEALDYLRVFLVDHVYFVSEEASSAAYKAGLGKWKEGKGYGAVLQRAAKEGLIEQAGSGRSRRRHNSPTPLWRSLMASGEALARAELEPVE